MTSDPDERPRIVLRRPGERPLAGLPERNRGYQSRGQRIQYEHQLHIWVKRIEEIAKNIDFQPSSRGWSYLQEQKGYITKGEFAKAERLINDCRKSGLLPLDICAEDERRQAEGVERLDGDIDDEME